MISLETPVKRAFIDLNDAPVASPVKRSFGPASRLEFNTAFKTWGNESNLLQRLPICLHF